MAKTDPKVIGSHNNDERKETIVDIDIVMESPTTYKTQNQRMKSYPLKRTSSFPQVSRTYRKEVRPRKTSQAMEPKEDDNGMTALEVVEEHFQLKRRQFQIEQEKKRAQFMEQQLREKCEFESLLSKLKLKHIRTLQAIESRTKQHSTYDNVDGENSDSENSHDEEDNEEANTENEATNENKSDFIVNAVTSDLKCPGCRQVMKPPVSIWRCEVGHLLCGYCRVNQSISSQNSQCSFSEDSHYTKDEDSEYITSEDSLYSLWSLDGESVRTSCPSCNAETWTAGLSHRSGQIVARAVHIEKIACTLFANQ